MHFEFTLLLSSVKSYGIDCDLSTALPYHMTIAILGTTFYTYGYDTDA